MKKKTAPKGKIELNPQFKRAYELMENSHKHLFITGRAGTGKSTLLTYFREHTKKEIVVLAPTGVAAVNIKGQTIHSFFGFKPDVTLQKIRKQSTSAEESIYKKLDAIVIDEISMVRADLLDCIDKFMRLNGKNKNRPFGGAQMIFIGDLYQLPPVLTSEDKHPFLQKYTSPYFFASHVFSQQQTLLSDAGEFALEFVELEKIYRQKDAEFIHILNAIRDNTVTEKQIAVINAQYDSTYEPEQEDFEIYLTTTNDMAARINEKELAKLGETVWTFRGTRSGKFEQKLLPTDDALEVKVGSQIMLLNNDRQGRWINGTIGKIEGIAKDNGMTLVWVELADGTVELVAPHTWDMYEYTYDKQKGHIETDVIGSFTQYPFKLAWAVTIHKAQGKTFDNVILDIGRGTFAPGQLYVALSRCTRLEGIVLATQISKRNVWTDMDVVKFVTRFQDTKTQK
ncbi:MAG: AAA family ATPase [Candidatus Magasanikbacteria bacterium CG10_big_fil_rev_8_21_14_0_10_42_10]|uniref:AAA family ATPase n=1 Tax=Candidatus Magasanikbacteria bacterium CG10_big_fil_rev_8_21_14_0_10_42_10 TaxID=1974649 RepID=A0A2H0TVK7_9BACT|nr:MAG: AAA family ATPase [Candidatus Magasanikbacteria bacterium CG10_big_fil_rev_8_21_14_0_10_42_10]